MSKNFRYFDAIVALFAASLLISNLAATKLIAFGPIITDGGAVLFPLVYILDDILQVQSTVTYQRNSPW